jgi:nucleoside-diphosphate-sugar epimerase
MAQGSDVWQGCQHEYRGANTRLLDRKAAVLKRAIVTGANGFVGQALVQELITHDVEVYALGRQRTNILGDKVTFIPCDIANIEAARSELPQKADVFFALAWTGTAGDARSDYDLQLKNAKWTADCVRFAKSVGCERFVGAGTIMEMETQAAVYQQGNRPGSAYIYGSGKTVAHEVAKCVAVQEGIDFLWTFITNAYGIGEVSPRFLNTTLRKIIIGERLQFTSATQNYDFVYVSDVARAFYLIAEHGRPFKEYIIGSSTAKPLRGFIEEIGRALAPDQLLVFGDVPFTGINLPLEAFDCSVTTEDTGFIPSVTFEDGVCRTMEWLKKSEGRN